jgi:uncharacterized protein (DUF1501 family)
MAIELSTRRDFLKTGMMGATLTILAPRLASAATARPRRVLVSVQLAGGNDPLNTLVPYTDGRYRALRPTLAIPEHDVLPVSDHFGFHPALAPLLPLYQRKALALVQGVGFPSLDRSHFRSQEVWQTGDESCGHDRRPRLGWIGRYADLYCERDATALTLVALTDRTPPEMMAAKKLATVAGDFEVFTGQPLRGEDPRFLAALHGMYGTPHPRPAAEAIRAHGALLFAALEEMPRTPRARTETTPYPRSPLGEALGETAALLSAHPGIISVLITVGGFDTHARQDSRHPLLLADFASSMAAFHQDLRARSLNDRVAVLAWSEFGRRAQENASRGTDHGKGGTVFLLGDAVEGGLHGERPNLAALEAGDLAAPIDFRSVYASIIEEWLGRDAEPVVRGRYAKLGLFRKG